MEKSFAEKVVEIKNLFSFFSKDEEKYSSLIAMGKKMPPFSESLKTPDRIVHGCQSTLYLQAECKEGKIFFSAASDALISAGLAALLIMAYSGETPETVLKNPPLFLQEIGILTSLSPNRSNGLHHIYLRMKQEALNFLITK